MSDRTHTLTANESLPAVPDVEDAVRDAINSPIAHEPLRKLVGPGVKVTIAFDDASGSYFQTRRTDFRQVAIELIVEELRKAGVELGDITLLCSQGLHRKLSRTELETFLGAPPRPPVRLQPALLSRCGGPGPAGPPGLNATRVRRRG